MNHEQLQRPPRVAAYALALLAGCSSPMGPPVFELAEEINSTYYWKPSTVSAGDLLRVTFRKRAEWNQDVQVHLDGSASFLSISAMPVAGMTLQDLDDTLTEAYSRIVPEPDISVGITEEAPRTYAVMGEVLAPGQFELPTDRALTLIEAIAQASGPNRRTAWMSNTQIIRWVPERGRLQSFVVDARPKHWFGGEPVLVQPFDVIYIPNTKVDRVAIWIDNYIRRMIPFPYLFPRFPI